MRDMVNSGDTEWAATSYKQTCDIVFPDNKNWQPIGKLRAGIPFLGEYNGDGHTISNINCDSEYAEIFEFLGGTVYNLGIESGVFKGDTIGSITGHGTPEGRIINCYNKASVIGKYRAGGICDNFPGLVMFCFNFGKVKGSSDDCVTAGICSYGEATVYLA